MDLIRPMQVESIGGKRYIFVYDDDCSRLSWIKCPKEKSDNFESFEALTLKLDHEKESSMFRIRSDHG